MSDKHIDRAMDLAEGFAIGYGVLAATILGLCLIVFWKVLNRFK
jgi:hypothetical protein